MRWKDPLFISLVAVILLRVWKMYPFGEIVPITTDFTTHFFRIWYMNEYGITGWNFFWYGGSTFLKLAAPLTYTIGASLSRLLSPLISYQVLMNLVWFLIPLAFYLFLEEYPLNKIEKSVALVIFSIFPTHLIYWTNSNLPALLSLLFGTLFWRSLKRYLDKRSGPVEVMVFLTLSLLTHPLVSFFLIIIICVWFLSSYSLREVKRMIPVVLLVVVLVSFWYIPFLNSVYFGRWGSVSVQENPFESLKGSVEIYLETRHIPFILFEGLMVIVCVTLLISIRYWKREWFREFFPVLLAILILSVLLSYHRAVLFLPMPLSIIMAKICDLRRVPVLISILLLISILGFYHLDFTKLPDAPETGNRTILYPIGNAYCDGCFYYSAFLSPMKGDEYVYGWFPQAINTDFLAGKRLKYLNLLNNPLELNHTQFNELARKGMINFVGIRDDQKDYISYFRKNKRYQEIGTKNGFIIFEAIPKFSYLSINDRDIDADIVKDRDSVIGRFNCSPGELLIKETYDPDWSVYVNNKRLKTYPDEDGFITALLNEEGECELRMVYRRSFWQ